MDYCLKMSNRCKHILKLINNDFAIKSICILITLISISYNISCCEYFSFEGDKGDRWNNCIGSSWNLDTNEQKSGEQSLKSGSVITLGNSRIDTISGICRFAYCSGNISFWWKTDISPNKGKLSFLINNIEICSCNSNEWSKIGPLDFERGDQLGWRAIRDADRDDLTGNGWIDDVCIVYDDDLENCCLTGSASNNQIFTNESFSPNHGSLLIPHSFMIEINNAALACGSDIIELQIKNESDGKLEVHELHHLNKSDKMIIFKDIVFTNPGKKIYRFLLGNYLSDEFEGPIISPLVVNVTPSEGSNLNSYWYYIDGLSYSNTSLYLEMKDPSSNEWKSLGKGQWGNNLTFYVPSLTFLEPFLGMVEFRFRTEYGVIGPFKGPYVFINYRNILADVDERFVAAEVRSDRCAERICILSNGCTYERVYTSCPYWERLEWRNTLINGAGVKFKSCD